VAELRLARGFLDDHRYAEALPLLERLTRLMPPHACTQQDLALALRGDGQLDRAQAVYHQALALWPSHADTHFNLGVLQAIHLGRLDDAIDSFEAYLHHGGSQQERARAQLYATRRSQRSHELRVKAAERQKRARVVNAERLRLLDEAAENSNDP